MGSHLKNFGGQLFPAGQTNVAKTSDSQDLVLLFDGAEEEIWVGDGVNYVISGAGANYTAGAFNSGTPSLNYTGLVDPLVFSFGYNFTYNGGQRPFVHTIPTGFEDFQTQNLPAVPVQDGRDYFRVVQAAGAFILLLNVLFCGYIVAPTVIPNYYIWIYWMVPLSWVYRALLLNEFTSEEYAEGDVGEEILATYGFFYKGEVFGREWIAYCFAYLCPFLLVCMIASAASLHYFHIEPKPTVTADTSEEEEEKGKCFQMEEIWTFS